MIQIAVRPPGVANHYWNAVLDRYTFSVDLHPYAQYSPVAYYTTAGLLPELVRLAAECYAEVTPLKAAGVAGGYY